MLKLSKIELGVLRFFALIEKTRVTRYLYVWVAIFMSIRFALWAAHFAETSPRPAEGVALIIGAIGIPLAAVTSFCFRDYSTTSR